MGKKRRGLRKWSYQTVKLMKDGQADGVITRVAGKGDCLVGNTLCFVLVEA